MLLFTRHIEAGGHLQETMENQPIGTNQILLLLGIALLTLNGVFSVFIGFMLSMWYVSIIILEYRGVLDKWNSTRVLGLILMIRTNRGKKAAEWIARPRRLWRIFGELSIWLCFSVMILLIFGILASALETARAPAEQQVLPATDILFIPGVTSFVPIFWPLLALIITVVIHEYGHGLQARAHGMRIRSFGVLLAGIIPVGAFYEPEQEEIRIAPSRERLRLFAAGPSINIVLTYVLVILLAGASHSLVATEKGVYAVGIVEGSGAEEAGLLPYELIMQVDDIALEDPEDLTNVLDAHVAGDTLILTVGTNPFYGPMETRTVEATLTDKKAYYYELCGEDSECKSNVDQAGIEGGEGFLGVSGIRSADSAARVYGLPFEDGLTMGQRAVLVALSPLLFGAIPIQNQGQTMVLQERAFLSAGEGLIPSILGTVGMLGLFDFLFWIMWISFLLGVANLIPLIPFDGGHMVRDAGHIVARKIMRGSNPLKIERLADRLSGYSSLLVLALVMVPIILPRFF